MTMPWRDTRIVELAIGDKRLLNVFVGRLSQNKVWIIAVNFRDRLTECERLPRRRLEPERCVESSKTSHVVNFMHLAFHNTFILILVLPCHWP
jgi:hypothetical protein